MPADGLPKFPLTCLQTAGFVDTDKVVKGKNTVIGECSVCGRRGRLNMHTVSVVASPRSVLREVHAKSLIYSLVCVRACSRFYLPR